MNGQISKENAGVGIHKSDTYSSAGRILAVVIFATVLLLAIRVQNAPAAGNAVDATCIECHSDMVNENIGKAYVHIPFMQQQCSICHIEESLPVERRVAGTSIDKTQIKEKDVRWIDFSASSSRESWFFVPPGQVLQNILVVKARSDSGDNFREFFELPAIETLPVKTADSQGPVIETVGVRGVYGGVLISAEIGWTTDEMADSEVIYGIDELQNSVKEDALTREHAITLQNLKAGVTYEFAVVSRDIFGNSTVSESGTFSTAAPAPLPPSKYELTEKTGIKLAAEFYRSESSYLVKLTANQPVIVKIGSIVEKRVRENAPAAGMLNVSFTASATYPSHIPLRNMDRISEVCRGCHAKKFESGNHVVDIGPSPGMIIPASYSTSSTGRITCVTCHNPHASDHEYMTVNSSKMELCVGCHKGYDVAPDKRRPVSPPMLMAQEEDQGGAVTVSVRIF